MLNTELSCKFAMHESRQVQFICVNEMCENHRIACLQCLKEFHSSHMNHIFEYNNLQSWQMKSEDIILQIKEVIQKLESITIQLKQLIYYRTNPTDKIILPSEKISSSINNTIKINNFGQLIKFDEINQCLVSIMNSLHQKQKRKIKIIEQQNFNLELYASQSLIRGDQLSAQIQTNQFYDRPKFRFQKEGNNSSNYTLSQERNFIKGSAGFCFCTPSISQNTLFAFKILDFGFLMSKIYIGVCLGDFKQQPDLKNVGHGFYLISQDGYVYSHHQQEQNNQDKSFIILRDDIIKLKVEMQNKMIYFINSRSNAVISLQFENDLMDIFPCVGFNGGLFSGSIQILDQF